MGYVKVGETIIKEIEWKFKYVHVGYINGRVVAEIFNRHGVYVCKFYIPTIHYFKERDATEEDCKKWAQQQLAEYAKSFLKEKKTP